MKTMPKIDGKGINESITTIIDRIRYRKYAKAGYTTVIYINKSNTSVKLLDGRIKDSLLHIPAIDSKKLVDKVYILPSKKIVTNLCFVQEHINETLDLTNPNTPKISDQLFKKFVAIKLLEDLQSFNLGQVLLGASIGTLLGFFMCVGFMLLYNTMI